MSSSANSSPPLSPQISSTQLCDPVLSAPFLCACSSSSGASSLGAASSGAHLVSAPADLPCGHLACSECIRKLDTCIIPDTMSTDSADFSLDSPPQSQFTIRVCPNVNCQRPFDLTQYGVNNFCVKLVESFKVKCPYHTHGCDWTGILGPSPYKSYSSHAESCSWKPIICQSCRSEVHSTDHELNECPKRITKCEKCDQLMPFDQLAAHQSHEDGCVHLRRCAYGCCSVVPSSEEDLQILTVTEGERSPGACSEFEFVEFPGAIDAPSEAEGRKTQPQVMKPLLFRSEEELETHYKNCPLKTEQCPSCQTTIHSVTKQDHVCIPSLFHLSQLLAKVQSLEKKLEVLSEKNHVKPFIADASSAAAPPLAIALFEVPQVTHHRLFARSSTLDVLSPPFQVGTSEFKLRLKKQAGVENVDWLLHCTSSEAVEVKCRIGFLNACISSSDAHWTDLQEVDGVIQEGASQMTHTFQGDKALLGIGYEQSISPKALVQRGGLDIINDSVVFICAIQSLTCEDESFLANGRAVDSAREAPLMFHLADGM